MKKNLLTLTALVGILLAGCQTMEEIVPEVTPEVRVTPEGKYMLTVEATKDIDTKALSLDGSTLNAYWKTGETVAVYLGGTYLGQLTATAGSDNTKATLSGVLDSVTGVAENSVLTLLFPRKDWDYTGQNGAAPSEDGPLATQYDYATASVTVKSVNTTDRTITVNSAAIFQNQQSMYRFGFKVGGTGDAIAIKSFTVSSANNALVRSRSWSGSDWVDNCGSISVEAAGTSTLTLPFVSLRNTLVSSSYAADDETVRDKYSFDVIGSDDALYLGEKKIPGKVMTTQGKFISAPSVSITKVELGQSSSTATEVW